LKELEYIIEHQISREIGCYLCISVRESDIDEMLPLAIDYSQPIASTSYGHGRNKHQQN
jgi:hypothetical protein